MVSVRVPAALISLQLHARGLGKQQSIPIAREATIEAQGIGGWNILQDTNCDSFKLFSQPNSVCLADHSRKTICAPSRKLIEINFMWSILRNVIGNTKNDNDFEKKKRKVGQILK